MRLISQTFIVAAGATVIDTNLLPATTPPVNSNVSNEAELRVEPPSVTMLLSGYRKAVQLPIEPLVELATAQIMPSVSNHADEMSLEPLSVNAQMSGDSSTAQQLIQQPAELSAAASEITPPVPCVISTQQVKPLSELHVHLKPTVSFQDLQPIPRRIRPSNKWNRCKPPSFLLTSNEHITFLESKVKSAPEGKKRQTSKRHVGADQDSKTRRGLDGSIAKQGRKKPATNQAARQARKTTKTAASSDADGDGLENRSLIADEDNTPCIYCEIPYSESSVNWFRCCVCDRWACGNCACMGRRPKAVFTCHDCK